MSILMSLVHLLTLVAHCLCNLHFRVSKMGIQYQYFPSKSRINEIILVTGNSDVVL